MDIGQGLASFGASMAGAMSDYHKKHAAYDEQMQLAQALSRLGINEQGQITPIDMGDGKKQQGIQPIIDKKALEIFTANNRAGFERNAGALEALNRMAVHGLAPIIGQLGQENLRSTRARTKLYQQAADTPFVEDAQGNRFRNTPSGPVPISGTTSSTAEAGRVQRHQINTAIKLRKDLASEIKGSAFGLSPEDFLREDVVPGTLDEKGKFAPIAKGQQGGNAVGIPDGQGGYTGFNMNDWTKIRGKAAEYQRLGQVAFSGLSGGKQDAPVLVQTPADARKLPPGTLVQTPDGRIGRTKGTPGPTAQPTPLPAPTAGEDEDETGEE